MTVCPWRFFTMDTHSETGNGELEKKRGDWWRKDDGFETHSCMKRIYKDVTRLRWTRGKTRKPEKVEYFQPPIRLPRSSLRICLARSLSVVLNVDSLSTVLSARQNEPHVDFSKESPLFFRETLNNSTHSHYNAIHRQITIVRLLISDGSWFVFLTTEKATLALPDRTEIPRAVPVGSEVGFESHTTKHFPSSTIGSVSFCAYAWHTNHTALRTTVSIVPTSLRNQQSPKNTVLTVKQSPPKLFKSRLQQFIPLVRTGRRDRKRIEALSELALSRRHSAWGPSARALNY
ncbi:hypothetical protein DNTS_022060 [Danionella cerebrum]|uniref:Uncharacterized protein n=1 Tax=Danionella cerebrum TaxID=2873325 RepID=A0A553PYT2_9TELE|nr:hypothetical protein DNTS_022060 [Danionella translucida]